MLAANYKEAYTDPKVFCAYWVLMCSKVFVVEMLSLWNCIGTRNNIAVCRHFVPGFGGMFICMAHFKAIHKTLR